MAGKLEIEVVPALSDNYIFMLLEPESGISAVVDPAEAAPVVAKLQASGRGLDWIISTHHHSDHVGGNLELKDRFGCKIVGPRADRDRIPGIDVEVGEGDTFELGKAVARVFDTPGHTRGHISYWFEGAHALFCGDTLFAVGCGRLLEGDAPTMWSSLSKLMVLPDDTKVYCGHEYTLSNARFARTVDPDNLALSQRLAQILSARGRNEPTIPTTIGREKATNPFLRAGNADIRRLLQMEEASDAEVFGEIRRRKDAA